MEMLSSVFNNPSDTELRDRAMKQAMCRADPPPSPDLFRFSVSVQHEAGEGAVLVVVPPVRLPAVQLDVYLVPGLEVQDHAVAGVVVVLVGVLGDGTGSYLEDKGVISGGETGLLF